MRKLRNTFKGLVCALALIGVAACSTTLQDIEGIEASRPDKLEFYQSVDGYPNVGRICIDGVALLQTTREYGDALSRVPEWDERCES